LSASPLDVCERLVIVQRDTGSLLYVFEILDGHLVDRYSNLDTVELVQMDFVVFEPDELCLDLEGA